MKILSKNLVILTAVIIAAFAANFLIVQSWQKDAMGTLLLTYSVNYVLTVLILIGFYFVSKNNAKQLGYTFLLSSFIKFGIFFVAIKPSLNMEGSLKSAAFAAFFIPYAICMIFEVVIAMKMLNQE